MVSTSVPSPGADDTSVAVAGVAWARSVTAAASLGAAIVHGASIPVHFDHGTRFGVAFVVMTLLGALAAALPLSAAWRRGLWFALLVNASIVGVWLLAVTWGIPGEETEAIGLASAVTTMLEVAAVAAAAIGLGLGRHALGAARPLGIGDVGRRAPLAALAAVMVLVAPGVATAADHDHGAGDHVDTAAHTDTDASGATGAAGGDHDHPNQQYGVPDAVAASTLTGLFSWAPSPVQSGGSGNAHHDTSSGVPCAPSDGQVAAADRLLVDTTFAIQRFRDPAAAVALGYRPLGFEPNGVYHYLNQQYIDDGRMLAPERPEALLYGRARDGSLYPVGVMYMAGNVLERGNRVGGCLTPWHRHGFPFARPGETSVEMMHVWTIPVPGGPYAEHIEGEYARIYLGIAPIDTDVGDPTATDGVTSTTVPFENLTTSFGLVAGGRVSVVTVLNALNVHRAQFCAEPLRSTLVARVNDTVLMDRLCDPVLNGPLPGASAPDLATVLRTLRAVTPGTAGTAGTSTSPSTTR